MSELPSIAARSETADRTGCCCTQSIFLRTRFLKYKRFLKPGLHFFLKAFKRESASVRATEGCGGVQTRLGARGGGCGGRRRGERPRRPPGGGRDRATRPAPRPPQPPAPAGGAVRCGAPRCYRIGSDRLLLCHRLR